MLGSVVNGSEEINYFIQHIDSKHVNSRFYYVIQYIPYILSPFELPIDYLYEKRTLDLDPLLLSTNHK